MCDTFVATSAATREGEIILAKNSDRHPNEAQNITFSPAQDHDSESSVQCTYMEVPQVRHTYAVLLSRPYWMFGAEMGVNEHGVAIGNEAVFTKEKYDRSNQALLGMDILRLALERSQSAEMATKVITGLLEQFGQGGRASLEEKIFYHNSYIVADAHSAYILETAGMHWVLKKVSDIASISNCLTIADDYDDSSLSLQEYKRREGYMKKGEKLNFMKSFSDTLYTHFAKGRVRKSCSYNILKERKGSLTVFDMIGILRDHNMDEPYRPGKRPMERICLHAGGLISSQSTGSMVAVLKKGMQPLVYFTGTSAPCLSYFKPHSLSRNQLEFQKNQFYHEGDNGIIDIYGSASNRYSDNTLWWLGEDIHRRVLMNYPSLAHKLRKKRDKSEKEAISEIDDCRSRDDLSIVCGKLAERLLKENQKECKIVKEEYDRLKGKYAVPWWYQRQWKGLNKKADFAL